MEYINSSDLIIIWEKHEYNVYIYCLVYLTKLNVVVFNYTFVNGIDLIWTFAVFL